MGTRMALLATETIFTMDGATDQERKPIYSIFQKSSEQDALKTNKDDSNHLPIQDTDSVTDSKTKAAIRVNKRSQDTAGEIVSAVPTKVTTYDDVKAELLEVDPNNTRRKRRRTASPVDEDSHDGIVKETNPVKMVVRKIGRPSKSAPPGQTFKVAKGLLGQHDSENMVSLVEEVPAPNDETTSNSGVCKRDLPESARCIEKKGKGEKKPSKVLRLNTKTGTIGSPPPKQAEPTTKLRGSSKSKQQKSRIVVLRYSLSRAQPLSTGEKINLICNGTRMAESFIEPKAMVPQNPVKILPQGSMKVTGTGSTNVPHPFFQTKAVIKKDNSQSTPQPPLSVPSSKESVNLVGAARFGSKPHKYIHTATPTQSKFAPNNNIAPAIFAGFGAVAKVSKVPGALEPAWPWNGMVHVRGENLSEPNHQHILSEYEARNQKLKYSAPQILASEDIIEQLAADLNLDEITQSIRDINLDKYPPLPICLRIPTKHFVSGSTLQRRIRPQLHNVIAANDNVDISFSPDELSGGGQAPPKTHPALNKLYTSIATTLSAFDKSQCETAPWTQKYSPISAMEVLQTGREAAILKEWLETLTVKSVETNNNANLIRSSTAKKELSGKRKRISKKLDGFVISDNEESDGMNELSESEEDSSPRGRQGALKTVVRTSSVTGKGFKDTGRFANGVLISGPHGCGKTAMVYAVAKELGFEVFEINSSTRRSGKDIMEKVGDMTRNHLVQQAENRTKDDLIDEDAKRISDALEDDLKSGRQGTMNSFFKLTGPKKAPAAPKKSAPLKTEANQSTIPPRLPSKQQKQSLILFEEVDILYEEDRQFWATVMNLLVTSKRPIIMTCTDESVVPIASLTLHAIIRLTPPPTTLAADHLLLIAANEGHQIRREAVTALYEGRNMDLRASLTELNLWCQFAVGDLRGGLGWIYPRWPRGSDIDQDGNIIRVISKDAYTTGMGWYSQDLLEEKNRVDIEDDMLKDSWSSWALDVSDWHETLDLSGWAEDFHPTCKDDSRAALAMYGQFTDSLSAADICSNGAFSSENYMPLDTSLPDLTMKAREDYVQGYEVINVAPLISFDHLATDISLCIKSRSRSYLQNDEHHSRGLEPSSHLNALSETSLIDTIKNRTVPIKTTRRDFSIAFDPISEREKKYVWTVATTLEPSCFDRNLSLIATDVAPFVRSIVASDARLQQERTKMSDLLSEGGRGGKRMRTTRAAMSALEGGQRAETRKEKYFGDLLNAEDVLYTGGRGWLEALPYSNSEVELGPGVENGRGDIVEA